jgi:hypothetical protein
VAEALGTFLLIFSAAAVNAKVVADISLGVAAGDPRFVARKTARRQGRRRPIRKRSGRIIMGGGNVTWWFGNSVDVVDEHYAMIGICELVVASWTCG